MSAKVGVIAWQRPHLICSSTGSSRSCSSDVSGELALEEKRIYESSLSFRWLLGQSDKLSEVSELSQSIITLPLNRHVILVMADGRLDSQHHLVYLSEMTEVHSNISKRLLAELAA